MMNRLRLRSAGTTHPGLVRSANEDSMAIRDDVGVWVVADGMGGHENGQWASGAIIAAVNAAAFSGDFDADVNTLAEALHGANDRIHAEAGGSGKRMGSTVVALHVSGDRFAALWAGDSRIYLLRGGELHRLTRDHTQVQELVDRNLMTPEEAERHPMSHVLSNAVGVQAQLRVDVVADTAVPKDVFLLCSDGLTGVVSDSEIAERLGALPIDAACRRLTELVLARGAPDNVTMVAVACEEMTALVLAPA
jgi:serine/threonine protein phosphatase PrpC